MIESNQEAYQTLGWIINRSEQGLFLVVADETIQKEIVRFYQRGATQIYDYKQHPNAYMFRDLEEWIMKLPETKTFMIANFHLAIQKEEDLKRLNFSRDMLEGLGKNIIFFTTQYGDDQLSCGAYDFYSFLKLRILFHNYVTEWEEKESKLFSAEEKSQESEWKTENLKELLNETYALIDQANEKFNKIQYNESEMLLLRARKIREKLLGEKHLEVAKIDNKLASVYYKQGKYQQAEKLYQKSLRVYEKVLGEEHRVTAMSYNNLAAAYNEQGKYQQAEELCQKSLRIREKILIEEHPDTAMSYNNLAIIYEKQGKYQQAEELYQKSLRIRKKVLGEEHPDTAMNYNNLAMVYEDQGKYKSALFYYFKVYKFFFKNFGLEYSATKEFCNDVERLYSYCELKEDFEQWLDKKLKE